jgi:predicted methyltransferase MtxX (methanogen marker protein 4)
MKNIQEIIMERVLKHRNKIGISLINETPEILASLKKAQKEVADVIIYSNHEIEGFKTKVFDNDEEIGRTMVRDYKAGIINQFVRGQVDDFGTVDEYKKQFDISKEEKRLDFALVEDIKGNQFFLTMCSNPEGQTLEDKLRIASGVSDWIKNEFGLSPKVAMMATCRPGSVGKDPVMTKSYEDAEAVVKFLQEKGMEAKNIHIELQSAIPWANLIIASNGTIGNQIFRVMVFLGGGKTYYCPTFFAGKGGYEDNSRNENNYYHHIVFASAMANKNL